MRRYFIAVLLLYALTPCVSAQQQPVRKSEKYKPPKVTTYLGGHQNGDSINPATAKLILSIPLQVIDAKNTAFQVENYRFLYKKKGVVPDPETGKPQENFTLSAGTFTETPLPKIWIDNVGLNLVNGEELYFFDIIVHDGKGHRFLAPDLKIFIR